MPPEGPNNYATFIYGERVKLIPNNSLEEPLPNIISYICKLIFGTEDAKVMDDFLQLQLDKVIIIEKNDHSSSMVLNETGAYPGKVTSSQFICKYCDTLKLWLNL